MSESESPERVARRLLCHYLAAFAYRTQKALRGAPESFATFEAGNRIRTPHDIVGHMDSVLGYARTHLNGGKYRVPRLPTFEAEVRRFHPTLEALADDLEKGVEFRDGGPEQLLQGPLADAMSHPGQPAMLRRQHGSPVPPENFFEADVRRGRYGIEQSPPVSPDADWPEAPDGARD